MATYQQQITAAQEPTRLAEERQDGTGFVAGQAVIRAFNTPATRSRCGFYFSNVTIPPGSTINTCTIDCSSSGGIGDVFADLFFNNVDNALDFVADPDVNSRALTTAPNVNWLEIDLPSGFVTASVDFSAHLQQIVDRPGWVSGNAVVMIMRGSVNGALLAAQLDRNNTATNPRLTVDFTPPVAPTVTTQAAMSIRRTAATGNGNVTATGGEDADERGFVFDTVGRVLPGDVAPAASGYQRVVNETGVFGAGAFALALGLLAPGTNYLVRAYAHNSVGYAYGGEVSFTTVQLQTVFGHGADLPRAIAATGNFGLPGWFGDAVATQAIVANTTYYIPIAIAQRTRFDRIGVSVSVAAAALSVARFGFVEMQPDGSPGLVVADEGTTLVDVNGDRLITIDRTLDRGAYFIAMNSDGAPTLDTFSATGLRSPVDGQSATLPAALNLVVQSIAAQAGVATGGLPNPSTAPDTPLSGLFAAVRLRTV